MVENADYLAFIRRSIVAAGRRAGDGDHEMLAGLAALRGEIDRAEMAAVHQLVTEHGFSHSEIARVLGITKQAAWQRFTKQRKEVPSQ